jgi:hypothetical protein
LLAGPRELRPLTWTVADAGARRAFLLVRAGCKPDLEQNLTLNGGEVRLAAEWRYYYGSTVAVTLAASIPADLSDD